MAANNEVTKITRKDMFNWIAGVLDTVEFENDEEREMAARATEMCVKYVAQLSKPAKPRVNKDAIEFAREAAAVLAAGEPDKVWTAKDLAGEMGVSSHKAAAAFRRLTQLGVVGLQPKEHKNDANSYTVVDATIEIAIPAE